MAKSKDYMRVYMHNRYVTRRKTALERLGGKCVRCGALENLEIDHIDRSSKSFDVADMYGLGEVKFLEEVDKCQLLCRPCHQLKTLSDRGMKSAPGTHGTLSSYRYCHCDECKLAKNLYSRDYRIKNGRKSQAKS